MSVSLSLSFGFFFISYTYFTQQSLLSVMKKRKKWTNIDLSRCVCFKKKAFEMCRSKTYLFSFFLFTAYIRRERHVWILSSYWFSWGLHTIINKRKQCHIYDIYLNFDLLWMRWQAHSMDNHRLEIEYRNETWWPAAMSNSFTLIENEKRKKRKKNSSNKTCIHSFRWNHHEKRERTNERNLLASLFLSPLYSGERETENHRKRKMTISYLFIWIKNNDSKLLIYSSCCLSLMSNRCTNQGTKCMRHSINSLSFV